MRSNKIFKLAVKIVIVASVIMIAMVDGAHEKIMWFNVFMWQICGLVSIIKEDYQEQINDAQKQIIKEQKKQIDILVNSILKEEITIKN